jgi:two-component system, OmpR family, phosphate regulon sensor histidine kinase PhoR
MPGESAHDRSVVDVLDEAAFIVDHNIVVLANEPARELLGRNIEGRDVRLAVRHPLALELILPGKDGEVEITGIGHVGRTSRLVVRKLTGGVVFVRMLDRSASVAAERMRVDFVANASHELRTPLSVILGYAETLTDEASLDVDHCSQFGSVIHAEAVRMLALIEDLMSLSRIEADRFVPPTELLSITDIIATAASQARIAADQRNCSIDIVVQDELPAVVGDRAQLVQLLDNLISNSVRYGCATPGCSVRVSATAVPGYVQLTVSDNGQGIPRQHLHRVTERFYRIDPARSRQSGGTGLGLAIVKHIVERHKGKLEINSNVGVGTDVVVRLPTGREV